MPKTVFEKMFVPAPRRVGRLGLEVHSNGPTRARLGCLAISGVALLAVSCSSKEEPAGDGGSAATAATGMGNSTGLSGGAGTSMAAGGSVASSATAAGGGATMNGGAVGSGDAAGGMAVASSGGPRGTGSADLSTGGVSGATSQASSGQGGLDGNGGATVQTGGASSGGGFAGMGGGMPSVGGSGGGGTGGSAATAAGEACAEGAAAAHYVDAMGGSDDNDGSSPDAAWQTLDRVNAELFQPGDAVCFRAGATWTGEFALQGSGTSQAPIVVDRYGDGNAPKIAAGSGDLQAILLRNVQYVEIKNLEITNDQGGPGDYRGVSVRGSNAGELSHIYLSNLWVHDVAGEVNWIGGSTSDNDPPWVTFQTGWDRSKRTGGIVFETEAGSTSATWFNDVIVEDSIISDTSFGGVMFKQLEALGGVRDSRNDSDFRPHTNIVVRGNFLSQSNTEWGCNTIYVTGSQHVLIERNVTKDSGTSAIEVYNSDDAVIQYNETYGTVRKAGGADSNGIDADRASTNTVIQYNYVHDNGDGILLAQFAFGDSVIRYNLIVNSSRMGINLHSDSAATSQIYNNLFYGSAALTNTSGDGQHLDATYNLSNNIFFASGGSASVRTGGNVTYTNNLFSGLSAVGSGAQTGDPLFMNAGAWPSGDQSGPALDALGGLMIQAGSPAINNGSAIADNGGFDFFGNTLYNGEPDIGPHEVQ